MKRIMCVATALAAACLIPTATPAVASSSACTHHLSGPQVCIRITGRNEWNAITAIWTNPPKRVKTQAVQLYSNGHKLFRPEKAHRVGDSIRYTWSAFDTGTDTKLCVRFAHSNRIACESTRYSGVPGPV